MRGFVSVVTDIHDRSFPVNLGVHSTVNLDFSDSMIAQDQAFDALARRDQQADLGLFKVLPQSAGEQTGEVFVALGGPASSAGATDPTVDRYGANPDARVVTDLVAVAIVPAVAGWRESASAAANLAKWKSLSEQVVVTFPSAMGPDGFQQALPKVASAVGEAEDDNAVSLSYAWTPDVLDDVDFGRFDAVALVNNSWLDIMLRPEAPSACFPLHLLHHSP